MHGGGETQPGNLYVPGKLKPAVSPISLVD